MSSPAHRLAAARASDSNVEPPANVVRLPGPRFRLHEPLGQGAHGPTWTARLDDGTAVIVKKVGSPAGAAGPSELEGSTRAGGPHLAPQAIVWHEGEAWVVTEAADEVLLDRLPARMRRGLVVVIGLGILSGLARLHQDGLWHGSLQPSNVLVGLDGSVRLTHYALTAVTGEREYAAARLADVRAAGAILSRLMGVSTEGRGGRSKAAESPLGRAVVAIAAMGRQQPPGYEATRASVVLWEAAGRLGSVRSRTLAAAQLGNLAAAVSGRLSRSEPPAQQSRPGSSASGPAGRPSGRDSPRARRAAPAGASLAPRTGRRGQARPAGWLVGAAAIALAATAALLSPLTAVPHDPTQAPVRAATRQPAPAGAGAASSAAPAALARPAAPAPTAAAATPAVPAPPIEPSLPAPAAPLAAGAVRFVALTAVGPCASGQQCHLEVRVGLVPAGQTRDVTWQVDAADACGAARYVLASGTVHAQRAWTLVIDYAVVAVPNIGAPLLEAVVHAPDSAASDYLRLAPAAC